MRAAQIIRYMGVTAGLRACFALARRRPVLVEGCLLPYDSSAAYHLAHSVEKLRRLAAYVEPGDRVLDVGAHAGLFSVFAARRGASVLAVEPDPAVAWFLRSNAEGLDVDVVEAAVTPTGESTVLYRVAASTQSSSTIESAAAEFGETEAVAVAGVTLEELGPADVVKLDIQGGESALPIPDCRVLLVEISDLDPDASDYRRRLEVAFGTPSVVNQVWGGADYMFTRSR